MGDTSCCDAVIGLCCGASLDSPRVWSRGEGNMRDGDMRACGRGMEGRSAQGHVAARGPHRAATAFPFLA